MWEQGVTSLAVTGRMAVRAMAKRKNQPEAERTAVPRCGDVMRSVRRAVVPRFALAESSQSLGGDCRGPTPRCPRRSIVSRAEIGWGAHLRVEGAWRRLIQHLGPMTSNG